MSRTPAYRKGQSVRRLRASWWSPALLLATALAACGGGDAPGSGEDRDTTLRESRVAGERDDREANRDEN